MEKLSQRIKDLRLSKGMSQESLAEESGLSLRTIQRIENNETVPRGDTLKRLAITLNTTPDELIDWKVQEDRAYLTMMNLSSLAFLFFPVLGIVVPLAMWIVQKDKIKDVDQLGKSILNFQITWVLVLFAYYLMLITGIWGKALGLIFGGIGSAVFLKILIPLFILYLYNILQTIINGVLISTRKKYRYVPAIKFLR
ncbi:MAG: helix-turn-helix domain-containing protein [Bacteroidales bacterium]|jgi:transcriptional regulator with XRE-family HTH domain|nr:helix-turn-helix domain-containing protein [Bacteroidales bacterium]